MNQSSVIVILCLAPWLSLVGVKAYEMIFVTMAYNIRYGKKLSQSFVLKVRQKGIQTAFRYLSRTRHNSNDVFQQMHKKCESAFSRILLSWLYKWPTLILLASVLLYYFTWQRYFATSLLLSATCLLLVSLEVCHEVVARLALGHLDNFRRYVAFDPSGLNELARIFYDRNRILKDFLTTILVQLSCFTFAFSSVYYCLYSFDPKSFNAPVDSLVNAIYFSVVILGTIGFGDIVPVTPISRMTVVLHVLTLVVFVIFITGHFFASLSGTPENIP